MSTTQNTRCPVVLSPYCHVRLDSGQWPVCPHENSSNGQAAGARADRTLFWPSLRARRWLLTCEGCDETPIEGLDRLALHSHTAQDCLPDNEPSKVPNTSSFLITDITDQGFIIFICVEARVSRSNNVMVHCSEAHRSKARNYVSFEWLTQVGKGVVGCDVRTLRTSQY